jgi:hypothetical protein
MTKLSIFVVIAMLVMVSSAFRFQSRMKAKQDPISDYTPNGCPHAVEDAWDGCTDGIDCGTLCCENCYNIGITRQSCSYTAIVNGCAT